MINYLVGCVYCIFFLFSFIQPDIPSSTNYRMFIAAYLTMSISTGNKQPLGTHYIHPSQFKNPFYLSPSISRKTPKPPFPTRSYRLKNQRNKTQQTRQHRPRNKHPSCPSSRRSSGTTRTPRVRGVLGVGIGTIARGRSRSRGLRPRTSPRCSLLRTERRRA